MTGTIVKNVHSGRRFLQAFVWRRGGIEDTLIADIDVEMGRPHEVRWLSGRAIASCTSPEAAAAAFRLALVGAQP